MTTLMEPATALRMLGEAVGEVAEKLRHSVVVVRGGRGRGGGSGTIWSEDGLVVTNSHVVGGERAEVITWDERALPARLVARDPERDLATLRVEARDLPAVEPGDSSA